MIPVACWNRWLAGWHRWAVTVVPWTVGAQPDAIERARIAARIDELNTLRGHDGR